MGLFAHDLRAGSRESCEQNLSSIGHRDRTAIDIRVRVEPFLAQLSNPAVGPSSIERRLRAVMARSREGLEGSDQPLPTGSSSYRPSMNPLPLSHGSASPAGAPSLGPRRTASA